MILVLEQGTIPHVEIKTIFAEAPFYITIIDRELKKAVNAEITNKDMFALIQYYFTNTDLEENDIRKEIMKWLVSLKEVEGYNKGSKRLKEME